MNVQQEMLFDFSLTMPRVLVSGNTAVVDNAKRIVSIDRQAIVIDTGNTFVSLAGDELIIKSLEEERIIIRGLLKGIEFVPHKKSG